MNNLERTHQGIISAMSPTLMEKELLRIDGQLQTLLASVGVIPDHRHPLPSDRLSLYVAALAKRTEGENLDIGDAMEVIGAVANLIKMFK